MLCTCKLQHPCTGELARHHRLLEQGRANTHVRVLGAVKGVKAEVTGLAIATLEHLHDGNEAEKLEEADPHKELLHSALLHGGIVKGGHLGVTENGLHAGELGDILDKHASGGEHAHTAVLELGLAEPPNVDEGADAEGVEANIASLPRHKCINLSACGTVSAQPFAAFRGCWLRVERGGGTEITQVPSKAGVSGRSRLPQPMYLAVTDAPWSMPSLYSCILRPLVAVPANDRDSGQ